MSGVACHHTPWTANRIEQRWAWHAIIAFKLADTVERRRAWHAIIAFGQHTRSNDVGRGMRSSSLGSINDRTTSSVVCNHRLWTSSHSRTASSVACHHRPWTANTVERLQALHASAAFGQHTRSNEVGRGMPSSPLGSTHGRTTSGVACHHSPWTANTVGRRQA